MIFECLFCRTRYRLDATRVPDAGLLVRCTRCGRVFRAFLPSVASAAEAGPGQTAHHAGTSQTGSSAVVPQSAAVPKPQPPPVAVSAPTPAGEIQRLARVVFSDIEVYNTGKVAEALRQNRFMEEFNAEMEEAHRMIRNRFPGLADVSDLFDKAMTQICEQRRAKASPTS